MREDAAEVLRKAEEFVEEKRREGWTQQDFANHLQPSPRNASVCILCRNGKALSVYNFKVGHRNFPGGKQEEGETPKATVIREIEEELGVIPLTIIELGSLDANNGWTIHLFISNIHDLEPKIMEPLKISDPQWMTYEEMIAEGVVVESEIFEKFGTEIRWFLLGTI